MRAPRAGTEYIAVTLSATTDGRPHRSVFSHWKGYTSSEPRLEIRAASLVNPEVIIATWAELGESRLVVHDEGELYIFHVLGGNAVVSYELTKTLHPEWLTPFEVVPYGHAGFVSASDFPTDAFRRAPTPKVRMQTLKRDNYRCRICGRRPDDYTDLELHVHHVRPWAEGGVTHQTNLITLCHTCHNGLAPHSEPELFEFLGLGRKDSSSNAVEHWEAVRRYRRVTLNTLRAADESDVGNSE
jgi:hypothetical protein